MAARPLSDATLHLIHALRNSLEQGIAQQDQSSAVRPMEERSMFGCYCFFVDGKLCIGVKGEALLVRLPPEQHMQYAEHEGLRELSPQGGMQGYFWINADVYQRRSDWQHWIDSALDYNPRAKASPKKQRRAKAASPLPSTTPRKSSSTAKYLPRAEAQAPSNAPVLRSKAKSLTTATPRKHSVFDDDE